MNNYRRCPNEKNQSSLNNKKEISSKAKPQVSALERNMSVENKKLKELIAYQNFNSVMDLSNQNLTDQDMGIIIQHGIVGKKCKSLNLWGNRFTHEGISILVGILDGNKTLKELDLSYNRISDRGVQMICTVLSSNTCVLQDIDLSSNGITDKGAIYLANMLKNNHTLTTLVLNHNEITNDGLKSLVDALAHDNRKLIQLKLDFNPWITGRGVDYIFQSLKDNQILKEVYVKNCSVEDQDLPMLQEKAITFGLDVFI
ncbi:unnamed protein product [Rotaria sp. Silwood1]|nr:unnamed protein product [Rotaria sp. Silwood1]CAF3476594.1 unnamed protein product [Rotaria sp. Silwood1]CAF4657805.1 unnamed protein product [Rotaria sp. Silwood1]